MSENVYITGTDLPQWSSEATLQGVQRAVDATRGLTASQNTILLKLLENSAKSMPVDFGPLVAEAKRQTIAQQAAADAAGRQADEASKANDEAKRQSDEQKRQGQENSLQMSGMQRLMAQVANKILPPDEAKRFNQKLIDSSENQEKLQKDLLRQQEKLGIGENRAVSIAAGGFEQFRNLREGMGMGTGDILSNLAGGNMSGANVAGAMIGGGAALYGAVQGARNFAIGQIEGRFDLATELRQSGLLSGINEIQNSFIDIAKTVNDTNMTLQEATEFTRQFSRSVGVVGVSESLKFVNELAYSRDLIGQFGLSFAQVATVSGTYLDTLERLGMLETMNAGTRERGMMSFISTVESTAQTLKVSMEEAAKMVSEYLGRDDISAMIMTAAGGLSPEMQAQIGQMGLMGPLGEIIAMGAIDPNRFMLTDEYQAMMNPALSGVRSIIETMQSELAMGGNAGEITARYSQQLADIVRNDPVVGQLVAMDDQVASLVANIARFAQTAEDATTTMQGQIPESDALVRRREDLVRQRDVAFESAISDTLNNMENSARFLDLMNTELELFETQIGAITTATETFENLIGGTLTASVGFVNNATTMLLESATALLGLMNANGGSSLYRGLIKDEVADTIDDAMEGFFGIGRGMSPEEMRTFLANEPGVANDANAMRYLVAENNRIAGGFNLDQALGGVNLENNANARFIIPAARRRNLRVGLSNLAGNILDNSITELSANGDLTNVSTEEMTALRDQAMLLANSNQITAAEYEEIMKSVVGTLTERQAETTDAGLRTDIGNLIATLRSVVRSID